MKLNELGYNQTIEELRKENNVKDFDIGRVIAEHKERYIVKTATGDIEAEVTGNLRFSAKSREDFPAVGDWVALIHYDADMAIIHAVLPRQSLIKRKAVGQSGEVQVIAANIDYAFLVQAVDRDFSINRLERYLTLCHSSRVQAIIIVTKTDLIDEDSLATILNKIHSRVKDVPVHAISNLNGEGVAELKSLIETGKTYCMLGSSGVGKSTLLNNLAGRQLMETAAISESINRGRHVTTHRELIVLDGGGIIIDNPGMREVGIADEAGGLESTFDEIQTLSKECRYSNCTHTVEAGCAVIEAAEKGELHNGAYQNYLKMQREKEHFEASVAEKRKRDKDFGKMVKNVKKDIKRRKGNR